MASSTKLKSTSGAKLECKREKEKGFVLDGTVVSRLANDETDRSAPSLDFGIPQYNALTDPHCKGYFKSKAVPKKLKTAIRSQEVSERLTALHSGWEEGRRGETCHPRVLQGGVCAFQSCTCERAFCSTVLNYKS